MKGFKNNKDAIRYAAEMVKRQERLYRENEILTVGLNRSVHVTERAFRDCFETFNRTAYGETYDALETWVDGVRVFCLVQKESKPDEITHQSV